MTFMFEHKRTFAIEGNLRRRVAIGCRRREIDNRNATGTR
jgi:hypothetical protein